MENKQPEEQAWYEVYPGILSAESNLQEEFRGSFPAPTENGHPQIKGRVPLF
jgi:hypothetical protein